MSYKTKYPEPSRDMHLVAPGPVVVEPGLSRTLMVYPCRCGVRTGFRLLSLNVPCCSEPCRLQYEADNDVKPTQPFTLRDTPWAEGQCVRVIVNGVEVAVVEDVVYDPALDFDPHEVFEVLSISPCSSSVEHSVDIGEVAGSIPASGTDQAATAEV